MAQKRTDSKKRKENKRKTQAGRKAESNNPETGIARRESTANIRTVNPFSLMRRFSEEMDRLFGDLRLGGGLAPGFGREFGRLADLEGLMWFPQVESFEREGKLIVRADLPGLSKDDINVDITDDAIKIRGEQGQK